MTGHSSVLLKKEIRQITRSKKTTAAAALVPALMLLFVASGDILTLRMGFGSKPIYLLSTSHPISGPYLLKHFALPILITISALVTPSIIMADVLLGERERRTFDLLVSLPISVREMVVTKLVAVLMFAAGVAIPLFVLNQVLVSATGYGSAQQSLAMIELLIAGILFSASSALFIALVAGEPRAANILSGLILGPVVPLESLILSAASGTTGISVCACLLTLLGVASLLGSLRMLSWERLATA